MPDPDRFHERYESAFRALYPDAARDIRAVSPQLVSPNLLSPTTVSLPSSVFQRARDAAWAFDALRTSPAYIDDVCARGQWPRSSDPGNRSVLTSLDFHLMPDGTLKLIEINTNASLSLMIDVAYRTHGLPNPFGGDFRDEIIETFFAEARASRLGRDPRAIAIVDQAPESQRLYIEFLAFQDLFRSRGIKCEIIDSARETPDTDLVYCRDTDFYFERPESATLREKFLNGSTCVTPNPFEYQLLADKERLIEIGRPGFLERVLPGDGEAERARAILRNCLLESRPVSEFEPDALWAERKKWFFKPARSFGGKAAYRGASIRRKAFDSLFTGDFVAQEYARPPEVDGFKRDLRFFVYRGRVQLGLARLYQGQTTNVQTPGGGSACLVEAD